MRESRARRWLLIGLVVLLGAGCNADWTQFGYNAANTRSTSDSSINLVNANSLTQAWSGATGGAVTSSPAIAGGVAYVGSGNGKLEAFSAAGTTGCSGTPSTCTPEWTGATGGAVTSSPAVSGSVVYVGSGDGKLYAFAAGSTGCSGTPTVCTPLWTGHTGGAVNSSPTVSGGVVYVGSSDGKLYAFDAAGTTGCSGTPKTCTPEWTGTTGGAVTSSPAVSGSAVYVGSSDGKLYAFNTAGTTGCSGTPKTCTPEWTGTTGGAVTSSPAISGSEVYVGSSDDKLYAFDAAGAAGCTGVPLVCSPLWTGATGGAITSSPAVSGTEVYVGSADGKLYAFATTSSAKCTSAPASCPALWTATIGGQIKSSPSVDGGVVFVGSTNGSIEAFDALGSLHCTGTSCSTLWTATTGLGVESSPAISGGVVYVGSDDAHLYAYRAAGLTTPVPPTVPAPHAVDGAGEITLRWAAATRVDLPIAGYVVQPYAGGVAQTAVDVGPGITSLTLTGLSETTAYSYTVAVEVSTVTGAPSPMSNVETPGPDMAPSNYQVDSAHDGHSTGSLPAAPAKLWSKSFDNHVSYPVVANGRVFVTVGDNGTGGYGARLYAFDQSTGAQLWGPIQLGGTYYIAGLAYEDHKVYTVNFGGQLTAYAEATGAQLWSTSLPGQYTFTSPPTAYRGIVYTGGAGEGGTLYAVDGNSGSLLWTAQVENGDHSAPAVDSTGVYASYACAVSYDFDPLTGAQRWMHSTSCEGGGGKTPVLVGNRLYVRDQVTGSTVLDTGTGASVGTFASTPAPAFDGSLEFNVNGTSLTAVNASSQTTAWTTTGDGTIDSAPLVVGGVVIVGGSSGKVQAFVESTGAPAWSVAAGSAVAAPDEQNADNLTGMATDGGRLFVGATDTLVAFG